MSTRVEVIEYSMGVVDELDVLHRAIARLMGSLETPDGKRLQSRTVLVIQMTDDCLVLGPPDADADEIMEALEAGLKSVREGEQRE